MDAFVLDVMLLCSFVFGAFLCGLIIPKNALRFGGKSFYGVALLGNSAMLFVSYILAHDEGAIPFAACLAACASGLQNAMCTMHLGAVVRTTHVTGTVTDIGSTSGRAAMIILRGLTKGSLGYLDRVELDVDLKKLRVLLIIFFSFAGGCYVGSLLYTNILLKTMLVPAVITGLCGLLYTFLRGTLKKQIKKMERKRIAEEMDEVHQALEVAHVMVKKHTTNKSGVPDEERREIAEQMEHALEALHNLQEAISELDEEEEESDGAARLPSFFSRRSERK